MTDAANDLVGGTRAIAATLQMSHNQTRYLLDRGVLPVFHLHPAGKKFYARRGDLARWLADRAASAGQSAA
ncbi:hypothetical protein [Lichenifustis flavocetrariae]|uniref:Helix-turn-helix domain-containing protein n=1 Tax=Lichenifustis flavocetrariae TaxID=2949735 RepID=A0AA41YU99_9HYPH|nr:hypothetical protein [Lichenifustis flavocetrariae]MCW6506973.1 hypothetical protein [Lichenifustis flavocetrariae]